MPQTDGPEMISRANFLRLGLVGLSTAALVAGCGEEDDEDDEDNGEEED